MKILQHFFRFTTGEKILIGYLLLAIIGITTSFYNLISLKGLHNENSIIINRDIQNIEISDKILEALISQELYARRYVIIRTPETFALLMRRNDEIFQLIDNLKKVPDQDDEAIKKIAELYIKYDNILKDSIKFLSNPASSQAKKYEALIGNTRDELMSAIKSIKLSAITDQNNRTKRANDIVKSAFRFTIIL